jgi:Putative MetA-pathway of phenol degradation
MGASWVTLGGLAIASVLLGWDARADEPQDDPRCQGTHSLASPLPDACLGLIDTDRPHQTDTPHVVAAGHFQFESAPAELQLGGTVGDRGGDRSAHLVLFDDNYKVGVVTGVDVQMLFTHAAYEPATRSALPPGPLGLRAKFNFVKESGWVPAITFVPWVLLPVAPSEVFRAGPYLFWGWELGEHFELEMNAGVLFSASPKPPVVAVVASALTYKPVETFGVFMDVYATGPDAALGTGMLWAFNRDMQVDLGTYLGLTGNEPVATPFVGFSVRR